jgi:predicted P-loop ATPase
MADEKYSIDNDPALRAGMEAEREKSTRRKVASSIVQIDEERKRGKRSTGGNKSGSGRPQWADVTEHGMPKKTCANARVAIEALGVSCRYDEFHDRVTIALAPISTIASRFKGFAIAHVSGANLETAGHLLRIEMHTNFDFDPGKDNTRDALVQLALISRFDPVRSYFDELMWDGKPRLDRWLTTYLSAPSSELNQWIGRLTLIAAVRRVRQPGCKFDQIPVWEGAEGTGKSSAIALMAISPENFSDQTILGVKDQQQQELLRGVLLYEISELGGMQRAQVEQVKAFASRTHDRARPAYGRSRVDLPRRGIMIGTTNADSYLKSQTGNRRFWPVKTGVIDLEGLRRDRDQVWAEAAAVEASGASLELPRDLWARARETQDERLEHDPWMDELEDLRGDVEGDEERVFTRDVFKKLGRAEGKATARDDMRLVSVMRKLGWRGPKMIRIDKAQRRGYVRACQRRDEAFALG